MPITTPPERVNQYKEDPEHFTHVLEHLFIPALESAGFEPISPKSTGSPVIHAEIIKQLSSCELVLCDMSILNPNVFFEFGIRTALDKPVALVVDDKTTPVPFDAGMLNFYKYRSSLDAWSIEEEKQALAKHVQQAYAKSQGRNELWKHFGVAQPGTFKPEDAELGEKLDLIMTRLSAIEMQQMRVVIPSEKTGYDLLSSWSRPPELLLDYPRGYERPYNEALMRALEDSLKTPLKPEVEKCKPQEPDSDNR